MNNLYSSAPWRSDPHKYISLDTLNIEKENVSWYWRLIGQIASWMILGGYLILPSTFDADAQIRFSEGVLSIIIVALLTGGYSLTALLWFACPSILFRVDSIFIPIFSVSLFGFLTTIYAFASSPRYSIDAASAPMTLALEVLSAIVYGALALFARRKISKLTHIATDPNAYNPHQSPNPYLNYHGTSTIGPWHDPIGYENVIPNMHPTARSPNSFDGGSTIAIAPPTEDDMVNGNLAKLLHQQDISAMSDAGRSTFTLEWPAGEEEDRRLGRMRTFSAGNSGAFLAPEQTRGSSSHSENSRSGPWTQIAHVIGTQRGKNRRPDGATGHQRAKSREERRREIELATL